VVQVEAHARWELRWASLRAANGAQAEARMRGDVVTRLPDLLKKVDAMARWASRRSFRKRRWCIRANGRPLWACPRRASTSEFDVLVAACALRGAGQRLRLVLDGPAARSSDGQRRSAAHGQPPGS